jgi:uncharacterized repeat protein (TIGR01451 family)
MQTFAERFSMQARRFFALTLSAWRIDPMGPLRSRVAAVLAAGLLLAAPATGQLCIADCNGDRKVNIDELVRCVSVALGLSPLGTCPACDGNGDGRVAIDELVQGVRNALELDASQCGPPATPTVTPTPTPPPSVELDIVLNPDPIQPGDTLSVTLVATNTWHADLLDVQIESTVPNQVDAFNPILAGGAQCIGGTSSSCERGERIVWNVGTLRVGKSVVVGMLPRVTSTGASVPPDGTAIDVAAVLRSGNRQLAMISDRVLVEADPLLELAIHQDGEPVPPGGLITYTLTFANRQLATPAANTVLRMPVPLGTELVSASDGGALAGGAVEWNLGTVAPGQAGVRQVVLAAGTQLDDGDLIRAEAEVSDDAGNLTSTALLTRVESSSPLALAMQLGPDPLRPGETVQVALTVTNTGAVPLTDVVADFIIPDAVVAFPPGLIPGGACPNAFTSSFCEPRERVVWQIGTLAPGAGVTVATVPSTAADLRAGTLLVFNASARAAGDVQASANRAVAIDADPAAPDGLLTYTLNFANRQLAVLANNSVLRMPVPVGTQFVAASDGGALAGNTVEWNLGTLAPGQAGVREVQVAVRPELVDGAIIRAEAHITDSVPANRVRANVVTRVHASIPLMLAMELNPDPLRPGESAQVALTVTNTGVVPLLGVVAEFIIPDGIAPFSSVLIPGGACPNAFNSSLCEPRERVVWQIGTLAPGAGVTLINVPSAAADLRAGTLLVFDASARAGDAPHVGASRAVAIQADPVLELELRPDAGPVMPDGLLTYTLSFANRQLAALANNTVLRMPVPVGTDFVAVSDGGTIVDDVVQWNLGMLAPGQAGVRELRVAVRPELTDGTLIRAEAELGDSVPADRVRANAVSRVRATTPLRLAMELNPDPLRPGESVQVALTVTNTGPIALLDVEAHFIIPDGIAPFSANLIPGGVCPNAFNSSLCEPRERVVWQIGTLAPGAGVTVITVPSAAADLRPGTLLVFNAAGEEGGGHQATASRALAAQADPVLELELREDADPIPAGETLTYTLSFSNRRTANLAQNVVLRMPVPAGTEFVAARNGGALVSGVVEWSLGALGPGEAGVRQLVVAVDPQLSDGDLISAEAEIADNVPANRVRSNAVTRVQALPPLVLGMELTPDVLRPGAPAQVSLTLTNTGPIALLDVVAEFIIPDGIAPFSASLIPGGACPNAFNSSLCEPRERVVWQIGTLAAGAGLTVTTVPAALADVRPGTLLVFNTLARAGGGVQVTSSETLAIQADPILDLAVREDVDPVSPGEMLTYTLAFGNRHAATSAQNAMLRMPVPAGTELVSASDGGAVVDDAIEWSLGTLAPGEAGLVELVVAVNEDLGDGTLLMAAAEIGDDVPVRRIRASAVTRVQDSPQLILGIETPSDVVPRNQQFQVGMRVTSRSPISLLGVTAAVILPEGLANFAAAGISGGSCPDALGSSLCQPRERVVGNVGTLQAESEAVITFPATLLAGTPAGSVIVFNGSASDASGHTADATRAIVVAP